MNCVFEGAQGYKLLDTKSVTKDPGTFVQSSRYTVKQKQWRFFMCLHSDDDQIHVISLPQDGTERGQAAGEGAISYSRERKNVVWSLSGYKVVEKDISLLLLQIATGLGIQRSEVWQCFFFICTRETFDALLTDTSSLSLIWLWYRIAFSTRADKLEPFTSYRNYYSLTFFYWTIHFPGMKKFLTFWIKHKSGW